MVWKLENPGIIIDGRSIFKTIIWLHILIRLHEAIRVEEKRRYDKIENDLRRIKKEQKILRKKQKAESK